MWWSRVANLVPEFNLDLKDLSIHVSKNSYTFQDLECTPAKNFCITSLIFWNQTSWRVLQEWVQGTKILAGQMPRELLLMGNNVCVFLVQHGSGYPEPPVPWTILVILLAFVIFRKRCLKSQGFVFEVLQVTSTRLVGTFYEEHWILLYWNPQYCAWKYAFLLCWLRTCIKLWTNGLPFSDSVATFARAGYSTGRWTKFPAEMGDYVDG